MRRESPEVAAQTNFPANKSGIRRSIEHLFSSRTIRLSWVDLVVLQFVSAYLPVPLLLV